MKLKTILLIVAALILLKNSYGQSLITLDSAEFKGLEITIAENKMLTDVNKKLEQNDSLRYANEILLNSKISELQKIIELKEEQLNTLEHIPKTEVKQGFGFFEVAGITISVGVIAFLAGRVR